MLLSFGVPEDAVDMYLLKLLPQLLDSQELPFPPMEIPQDALVTQGFEIDTRPLARKAKGNQL